MSPKAAQQAEAEDTMEEAGETALLGPSLVFGAPDLAGKKVNQDNSHISPPHDADFVNHCNAKPPLLLRAGPAPCGRLFPALQPACWTGL